MTPQAALIELLGRVGASQGAAVLINDDELNQWPNAVVAAMKSQRLLAKARPATSAICPGCERECVMPVHVSPAEINWPAQAFISCDKRDDISKVPVDFCRLEQWQTTGELIAAVLAKLLGLSQPSTQAADGKRWNIGVLKGKKHKSLVTLMADDNLNLLLAGHTVPLAEVLAIEKNVLTLDKSELIRLVDKPAGNPETETPEQRRERLRERVREEKAKRTKAFLRLVAEEERISVSRLKQLTLADPSPANMWSSLAIAPKKGASSKRIKPKH